MEEKLIHISDERGLELVGNVPLEMIKKTEDAIKHPSPTIASLCKQNDPKSAKNVVLYFLNDFDRSINVVNGLTPDQKREVATLIVEDLPLLTVHDLRVIFRNAKKGDYGEYYNRMDVPMVFRWCKEYLHQRSLKYAEMSRAQHKETK